MKGIVVPEPEADYSADPVELFFDLAYVFAFSQLVGRLVGAPTWEGVGRTTLLFLLLWLAWTQLTWAANAVPGNGRSVRLILLAATVASVPMAAAVTTAFDEGGPVFAIPLALILLGGLALMATGLETGSDEFHSVVRYSIPNIVAMSVLVVGSFLDDRARLVAWTASIVIVGWGTVKAGGGAWIIRSGHFAERHGLIVIIALGEVVVALGIPVVAGLEDGRGFPGRTVVALLAAGAFAGLLWWGYFDRPQRALEHRAGEVPAADRGRFARDVYTYLHAPIVAGIVLAAAAIEEIALHPTDEVPLEFRLMFAAGLAGFLLGVVGAVWRAFGVYAKERVIAFGAITALIVAADGIDGVALLVAVDVMLAVMLVVEHRRIERPSVSPA
ncbi:MAG: low temperature requirement protein A [Ilumatobacteraceae bacterium]|nr:low temperature requirement protein A [Ilumatobacteraceae bacterium]